MSPNTTTPTQPPTTAAGRVAWHDVTAFQRDVVVARATLDAARPSGSRIAVRLEEMYGEEIVDSRLYQALDALVDLGLFEKGQGTTDARTNWYELTDEARRLLEAQADRCARAAGCRLACQ